MNFLFVDRILNLVPGKSTLALKHITASDPYLASNQAGQITLLPCIMGEAIGQLCSWNVIKSSHYQLRLIGGVVGEVLIHGQAFLGDTLILENTIHSLDLENHVVHFQGIARVGSKILLEVNSGLGPLLPVNGFGNAERVKTEFTHLYRPGEIPHIPEGQSIAKNIHINYDLSFDRIIEWEQGKQVLAQKNISLLAPYLSDHFPERPVLPLSLLLESKLQLAYPFIQEIMHSDKIQIRPTAVRRIKMNDFVEPGSILLTRMQLKAKTDHHFTFSYRTEVENRRVCVCEADFKVDS